MADVSNVSYPMSSCPKGVSESAECPIRFQFSQMKMMRHSMYAMYTSSKLHTNARMVQAVPFGLMCMSFPILSDILFMPVYCILIEPFADS